MSRCVVFAYHNVGYRCLSVLLDRGMEVALVVTHEDDPGETQWFESVAELSALHGIPVITPEDPNDPQVVARVRELRPDFLFSFYYRRMLKEGLLGAPRRGALNMHGSLLPRYRGRVPVNWAIIHGETETGASLHYMELKPDAGDLVDQQAVPILKDDTALGGLSQGGLRGGARPAPLPSPASRGPGPAHSPRSVQGQLLRRTPSRGRPHRLERAGRSDPQPHPGRRPPLSGSLHDPRRAAPAHSAQPSGADAARHPESAPASITRRAACYADCPDGRRLHVLCFELAPDVCSAEQFFARFATRPQRLGD